MKTHTLFPVPLAYSYLSAGDAIELTDDGYSLLDTNALITGGREGYLAFVVTGDSMVDTIQPGFIVFIDTYQQPQNGDVVVANVNGKNCIKIFERFEAKLLLVPKNGNYKPREIKASDTFHILGVVKAHLAVY